MSGYAVPLRYSFVSPPVRVGCADRFRSRDRCGACELWELARRGQNLLSGREEKNLRLLADKISGYGQSVHQRYPTGDVVVSERDLAEQLRKPHNAVATALNLLLSEQKVQRAPLKGYWKLNV